MTTVIDAEKLIQDLAYVENLIAGSVVLQATRHHVFTNDQGVAVEVEGAHWEARAWRAVFAGRIYPSHIDRHNVRRQLVIASRVRIEIVEHPNRGDDGRATTGLMFIVACVGLFLWGFAHGSRTPNGAWIAAVAIVGAVVVLLATGITRNRRGERAAAARGEKNSKALKQDTSGAHYLDGA